MKSAFRVATAGIAVVATMAALAGCTAAKPAADNQKVSISVVSLIPGSKQEAFDAFDAQVKQFEKANPNITVTPQEYEWTGPTFAAQLAGGTLPDVFTIPFTDGKTLIENGQLADITSLVKALPYADKFNPKVVNAVQDAKGNFFGIPTAAYGSALHYNRALFTAAGLDPDKPPTTWKEVEADAKQIAEKTGQAGYMQMTQNNTGGWQLTTATYARGGRVETTKNGKTTVTLDNAATKSALQFLHNVRWVDNAAGSNFLLDWGTINQAFGAGQIGMYTSGSDIYTNLVQSQSLDPKDYGMTVIPLEGKNSGTLGGGTIAAVNIKATPAQKAAAVKWIDFYYMKKLTNKSAAVLDAKTLDESSQPVGVPALPIFDKKTLDTSQGWIKPYINVPTNQMAGFSNGIYKQAPIGEPSAHTQELYAALDTVVQAVLTDKNANIDALLKSATADVQAIVDAG
jgi:ABC-type glycerol-3-phosphate transport system substrate-binding protein